MQRFFLYLECPLLEVFTVQEAMERGDVVKLPIKDTLKEVKPPIL